MVKRFYLKTIALLAITLCLANAARAQSIQKGAIEKCSKNLGTLAVVEPKVMSHYREQST